MLQTIKRKIIIGLITVATLASLIVPSGLSVAKATQIESVQQVQVNSNTLKDLKKLDIDLDSLTDEQLGLVEKMADVEQTTRLVSSSEEKEIKTKFSDGLSNNSFSLHVNPDILNLQEAVVLQSIDEVTNKAYYVITVPLSDDNYNMFSRVTAVYEENGDFVSYQEGLITKSEIGTFQIQSYIDGQLQKNEVLEDKYVSNDEMSEELNQISQKTMNLVQTRGVAAIAACLAVVLGISAYVANLIAGVCGVSCAFLIVGICGPCIAGFCALGGAAIGGAVACFKL